MNEEILNKLVDLYAERELPAELEDPLENAAGRDAGLHREMASLRTTVELIRREPNLPEEFGEETRDRILNEIAHASGLNREAVEAPVPAPVLFQYALPDVPGQNAS